MPARRVGKFFRQCLRTSDRDGAGSRELKIAQCTQFAAKGEAPHRDAEFVPRQLDQIERPPAHDAVHGWDRPNLAGCGLARAVNIVPQRCLAGRLARRQASGPFA